jgi:hypothetical protein
MTQSSNFLRPTRLLILSLILVLVVSAPLAVHAQGGAAGLPLLPAGTHIGVVYSDPQPATDNGLDTVFAQISAAGASVYQLSFSWADLEPQPGVIDTAPLAQALSVLQMMGLRPYLVIKTIDTTRLALPADLAGTSFDDPALQTRFAALLDEVVPQLVANGGFFLSVGNEVDVWLADHPADVEPYLDFVAASRAHVQAQVAQMGLGATLSFAALQDNANLVSDLLATSDAAVFTYYPVSNDVPADPGAVAADLDQMAQAAGSLPVLLQEVGYPAGTDGSSADAQREFVANLFAAIPDQPNLRLVSYLQLSDWSDVVCSYFVDYYGMSHDYLCSVGLRAYDGTPKPAFEAFMTGLAGLR